MCTKECLSKDFCQFIWRFVIDGGGFLVPSLSNLCTLVACRRHAVFWAFIAMFRSYLVWSPAFTYWFLVLISQGGILDDMDKWSGQGLKFSLSPQRKLRTLFPAHRCNELVQGPAAYQQPLQLAFYLLGYRCPSLWPLNSSSPTLGVKLSLLWCPPGNEFLRVPTLLAEPSLLRCFELLYGPAYTLGTFHCPGWRDWKTQGIFFFLQSLLLLILLGKVKQYNRLKQKKSLWVREMTCPEHPKVISRGELSLQNRAALPSLLNLAKPLEGRHAELP